MKRDLLKVCGDTNAPGLTTKAYAVCSCDIDVFPGMKTYTNPGDTITLDGDITLDALKQFFTLNIVEDTGKLTENAVGETGSKSMESMYEGFIPGTGAANLEFIKDQLNACDVFVVKDAEGQMRVLGTKDRPAFLDSVEINQAENRDHNNCGQNRFGKMVNRFGEEQQGSGHHQGADN